MGTIKPSLNKVCIIEVHSKLFSDLAKKNKFPWKKIQSKTIFLTFINFRADYTCVWILKARQVRAAIMDCYYQTNQKLLVS